MESFMRMVECRKLDFLIVIRVIEILDAGQSMTGRTCPDVIQSIATFDADNWCFPPDNISIEH